MQPALSGVALIGSGYIIKHYFLGAGLIFIKALLAVCGIMILFYGVNLRGLKMSSTAQNVLMLIKITMIWC